MLQVDHYSSELFLMITDDNNDNFNENRSIMGGLIEAWPYLWTKYLMCDRRNDGKDIIDKSDEDVVDGDDVGVH